MIGERERVRATLYMLYMAAVVATRGNPTIKMFYQRLVWVGKRQELGSHCPYAETVDYAQHDAHPSDALADGTTSARVTVKTVTSLVFVAHTYLFRFRYIPSVPARWQCTISPEP